MKFSLVAVTALLSSVAFASPIAHADSSLAARAAKKPDQGALVAQDFEVIAQQTTLLNQTLNIFHRGGRSVVIAYRIRKQALNITATLKKTITDNSNSGNFSVDNTNLAVGSFLDALGPITQALMNFQTKKRAVAAAVFGFGDLSKTVYQVTSELRSLTNTLAPAFVAHIDPSTGYQDLAPGIISELLKNFDNTLAVYKSCSGQVCLPAIPDSFPV